jgi:hypothetical protein
MKMLIGTVEQSAKRQPSNGIIYQLCAAVNAAAGERIHLLSRAQSGFTPGFTGASRIRFPLPPASISASRRSPASSHNSVKSGNQFAHVEYSAYGNNHSHMPNDLLVRR